MKRFIISFCKAAIQPGEDSSTAKNEATIEGIKNEK
jgi:hypothetical protein